MDMTHAYWEENSNIQRVKYEGCSDEIRAKDERGLYQCCDTNLNFSTATCSEDDSEYGPYKKSKVTRQDPMSHRIIEKRRRDRMNNCLADLSRLIPTEYLKKGRGRIEKTEIIEMAIKHMKYLQQEHGTPSEHYRLGYQECMSEAMRFMVEVEGHFPREGVCVRILNHLQKHCESLSRISRRPQPSNPPMTDHRLIPPQEVASSQHMEVAEYQTPKQELNNNTGIFMAALSDPEGYEKLAECNGNGVSYKYKTNIKLRFNQDLNEGVKRKSIENRRNSATSVENHSSSRSTPPSGEHYTRISEPENLGISPSESNSSLNQLKVEQVPRSELRPYSPTAKHSPDDRANFTVPIFVLHAKGSYYIPLTIDYKTLLPHLRNYDILGVSPGINNSVLHPVTINVNFQPNCVSGKYKAEFNNNWH